MNKYKWLEKRTLRSVDQLRLWPENPRLDPEENHISIQDYVLDLVSDNSEKEAFFKLVDSIAADGFIPADPIVVWQDTGNTKYYVAEGNRRVLALKLLRQPDKSPRAIRSFIRKKSELIDRNTIEKIKVSVAPNLGDAEWYINQRHANSSLQRPWSRLQSQRWIASLYDKYQGDIEKVSSATKLSKSQLEYMLRILNVRDLALNKEILSKLNETEKEKVRSHRIPMTILERWFVNPQVKEAWGFEFDGNEIQIYSNLKSFMNAYSVWLKMVIHRSELDVPIKIDTRTITSDLDKLLTYLPKVSFEEFDTESENRGSENPNNEGTSSEKSTDSGASQTENDAEESSEDDGKESHTKRPLNKNPDRNQLVVDTCKLSTSNHKLDAIFREFKKLPVSRYKNTTAAALRVFLDLAIAEHIATEGCADDLRDAYKNKPLQDITLKQRLEFIKKNKLTAKTASYKVVDKLLNSQNEHSLDTLNNYIHGSDQQHTNRRFLNGFWDFLTPLLVILVGMDDK